MREVEPGGESGPRKRILWEFKRLLSFPCCSGAFIVVASLTDRYELMIGRWKRFYCMSNGKI